MPFEEKFTWVSTVVSTGVAAVYFATVLGQVPTVPIAEIAYQRLLLIAIGSLIVLTIVGAIITAVATAIGTAVSAKITGEGSIEDSVADIGRKDERDEDINRRGELIGYYVSSAGMVGVMALAMLRYDQFWIANALYLSFVVGAIVAAVAKLVAYRRGF